MKLTFDWNCVIEVENDQPQANAVSDLVAAHRKGELKVAVLAASASENTKSKEMPQTATHFQDRLDNLGWSDLPLVPVPCVIGLIFIGSSFPIDDGPKFERKIDELWQIIAPSIPREPKDNFPDAMSIDDNWLQSKALSKWRNAWCDVISAYSHIHAKRDIFVTNNLKDFQKHSRKLASLGMKHISSADNTVSLITSLEG